MQISNKLNDKLVRSDHPPNDKREGVCIYFKSSLPIQTLRISMVHECINLEITVDSKLCNTICLYRSPNQHIEEFETFVKHPDFNLEFIFNKNSYLTVVIGDFNAKSRNWKKKATKPLLVNLNFMRSL